MATERSVPIPVSRPAKILRLVLSLWILVVIGVLFAFWVPVLLPALPKGVAIALGVGCGVISGGMVAGGLTFQWSRTGGPGTQAMVGRALSSRELPSQVDVRLWSVLLDYQETSVRRTKYLVAGLLVVAAGALYFAITSTDSELMQTAWVVAVLCVGLSIWGPIDARTRGVKVKILREQLDARSR